jgi:formylglycine-generating enzyme required for sulfatase activity/uncharacterized caspase-like protein
MRNILIAACMAIMATLAITPGHAEKRIALVIGNSAYLNEPGLRNPANDAAAMVDLFKAARFDVVEPRRDVGNAALRRAIRDFADSAHNADIAVVYYSGHGIEVDGTNYLIPVDARLERDFDVEDEAVSLDRVMKAIEPARVRIVILDACRDNPFQRTMKATVQTRSIHRGLAEIQLPTSGMLVAFAAKAGTTAQDGEGSNGPFTAALLKHIATPGLDLRLAFGRVRDDVLDATAGRQEPFIYHSLGGQTVSLVDTPATAMGASPPPPSVANEAAQAWAAVKDTSSAAVLDDFIRRYADSIYGTLAKDRRENLTRREAATAVPATAEAVTPPSLQVDDSRKVEGGQKPDERREKVAAVAPPVAPAVPGAEVLNREPPEGTLLSGKRVLVDDGTCPKGQIKELVGGDRKKGIDRTRRCIAAPSTVALLIIAGPCLGGAVTVSLSARCAGPLSAAQERSLKPKDIFKECDDCPEMVVVPPGSFTMGSTQSAGEQASNEAPDHQVTFARAFAVGRFHVTVDQFGAFVTATGYSGADVCSTIEGGKREERPGRSWQNPGFAQVGSHPALCLSWNDAQAYVEWLKRKTGKSYRLLTEAEWEYAARGRTEPGKYPRYSFGNDEKDLCRFGNGADQTTNSSAAAGVRNWPATAPCKDGHAYTAPVGQFAANDFDLYDMQGNALQWTQDCYHDDYVGAPSNGSAWTSGDCSRRMLRGGGWNDGPWYLRAARRGAQQLSYHGYGIGLRVARTIAN